MKIRRFANLNGVEIGLVTILGVLGGIYIWKPIFDKASKANLPAQNQPVAETSKGSN